MASNLKLEQLNYSPIISVCVSVSIQQFTHTYYMRLFPNAFLIASLLTLLLLPTAVFADKRNSSAEFVILLEQLASAETELEGRAAEASVWRYWFDMQRRKAYDYEAAEKYLDEVVKLAPHYAEGYNQRAFVRFLRDNPIAAEIDLQNTLKLEPKHFGALSGLFHVLRMQDRQDAALSALKEAVKIHPWLQERFALPERLWPESYRAIHSTDQEI